jgi:hypothetical protein
VYILFILFYVLFICSLLLLLIVAVTVFVVSIIVVFAILVDVIVVVEIVVFAFLMRINQAHLDKRSGLTHPGCELYIVVSEE